MSQLQVPFVVFKDVQSHGQSAFERRLAQPAACVPELLMQQTLPITSHYHTTSHHTFSSLFHLFHFAPPPPASLVQRW